MKLNELIKIHHSLYNQDSLLALYTPGRVNLIGEHIDYNGGLVMPFAITKGTYVVASKRSDTKVNCYSVNFATVGVISFDANCYQKDNNWADFVKGAVYELEKEGIKLTSGLDLTFFGTIPTSSGLSSSASLEVAIFNAFKKVYHLNIDDEKIALLSQAIEHDFIGVNCGIMDQYIISCAKDNSVMLLNCANLEHHYSNFDLGNYKLLIMNSCKKRDLAASKYNERLEECRSALDIVKKHYQVDDLCSLSVFDLIHIKDDFSDEVIYNRAYHCASEMARVKDCYNALMESDLASVGMLLNQSHESLKNLYEVSCLELDTLVEEARKIDSCLGARMTGAGFGGCAIAIIEEKDVDMAINSISKAYKEKIGYDCEIYVASVSGNTKELDLEKDYEL